MGAARRHALKLRQRQTPKMQQIEYQQRVVYAPGSGGHAGLRSAPPPPSGTQLLLRVHQTTLHPGPECSVVPHGLAVEQVRQDPLDALVDMAEPRLLASQLLNGRFVDDRFEPGRRYT